MQFLSIIYLCIYICNHKYFYSQLDTSTISRCLWHFSLFIKKIATLSSFKVTNHYLFNLFTSKIVFAGIYSRRIFRCTSVQHAILSVGSRPLLPNGSNGEQRHRFTMTTMLTITFVIGRSRARCEYHLAPTYGKLAWCRIVCERPRLKSRLKRICRFAQRRDVATRCHRAASKMSIRTGASLNSASKVLEIKIIYSFIILVF